MNEAEREATYQEIYALTRQISSLCHRRGNLIVQAAIADVLAMSLANEEEQHRDYMLDLFVRQVRALIPLNCDILADALRSSERDNCEPKETANDGNSDPTPGADAGRPGVSY